MLVIGLTGGIGSGKSTVAKYFNDLEITVIDADLIAHQLTLPNQPAFNEIIAHFGQAILNQDHAIDRAKLRNIVFADARQKMWLENLLHPLIFDEILHGINVAKSTYCIVMAPLLLEKSHTIKIDRILVIDTEEDLQIQRVKQRDNLSIIEIKNIMQTQFARAERLAKADDIIVNNKGLENLNYEVKKLHEKYSQLAK